MKSPFENTEKYPGKYTQMRSKFHDAQINALCQICDRFIRFLVILAQLRSNLCTSTV